MRIAMPSFEYSAFRSVLEVLGENGWILDVNMMLGDLAKRSWDNVELHQMHEDNAWDFSYGVALSWLSKLLREGR